MSNTTGSRDYEYNWTKIRESIASLNCERHVVAPGEAVFGKLVDRASFEKVQKSSGFVKVSEEFQPPAASGDQCRDEGDGGSQGDRAVRNPQEAAHR